MFVYKGNQIKWNQFSHLIDPIMTRERKTIPTNRAAIIIVSAANTALTWLTSTQLDVPAKEKKQFRVEWRIKHN